MPTFYPELNGEQLKLYLKQSKWIKCKKNVEVFDEEGMGRGVRVLKSFTSGDVVCWYSDEVFLTIQPDVVYQFDD